MNRAFYSASITEFLGTDSDTVLGRLVRSSGFPVEQPQRDAWLAQLDILRAVLPPYSGRGSVYLEYGIPRLGRRVDAVLVIGPAILVLEFKVGEARFNPRDIDQVCDYALDLKNFHETSHDQYVVPILIPTKARTVQSIVAATPQEDRLLLPIRSSVAVLPNVLNSAVAFATCPDIDVSAWERGRYCPTPTIIEAATALYRGHSVTEISRSDASAINLSRTSDAVSQIIRVAKAQREKAICFVTGVPGAGKTLVGLNIATQHFDRDSDLYSVYLSGNGPLVRILREALARDKVERACEHGNKTTLTEARSEVKAFIQNVHQFRDDCLTDVSQPPIEHVALFDEAQRAWDQRQTATFMSQRRGHQDFAHSEPEFLISCLDRHRDWAVVVCLVGGGQEINTGEAGIGEWLSAVERSFPQWRVHMSPKLTESEYGAGEMVERARRRGGVTFGDDLHLAVSMRSFRAEHVSSFVKHVLDLEEEAAAAALHRVQHKYPVVVTRDLPTAKAWLRQQARGSERYGLMVSSHAERLKPFAIDVKSPVDPVHWFLQGKEDVRSSYYLEDVATEFRVQGLELDWACVTWDGDFRYTPDGWEHWSFRGNRWERIRSPERQKYLKNAYRVLLTRARQGMVIVVPDADDSDPTRQRVFYDETFDYLTRIGLPVI